MAIVDTVVLVFGSSTVPGLQARAALTEAIDLARYVEPCVIQRQLGPEWLQIQFVIQSQELRELWRMRLLNVSAIQEHFDGKVHEGSAAPSNLAVLLPVLDYLGVIHGGVVSAQKAKLLPLPIIALPHGGKSRFRVELAAELMDNFCHRARNNAPLIRVRVRCLIEGQELIPEYRVLLL
jgi:hypothetical protein